ncbi:MAG: hypothetical protein U5J63_10390 [Fodinibius sp.]|nr:hypothetical protein [Fodinibius sp.]
MVEQNPAHLLIVPKKDKPLPKTASKEDINRMMELAEGNSARIGTDTEPFWNCYTAPAYGSVNLWDSMKQISIPN